MTDTVTDMTLTHQARIESHKSGWVGVCSCHWRSLEDKTATPVRARIAHHIAMCDERTVGIAQDARRAMLRMTNSELIDAAMSGVVNHYARSGA